MADSVMEAVARRFGLGRLEAEPVRVAGGLSNELWRVRTDRGVFAVKRMVVNADRPDFVGNVEGAYGVERRAWERGVPMPEPVPVGGRALAEVDGGLFRAHRWVDGEPAAGTAVEAARLLAAVHAAGEPRLGAVAGEGWVADRWGSELVELTGRVAQRETSGVIVDSHRDLDGKNTLRRRDGVLLALDWDAAGPISAVQEAAGVALDWSGGDPAVFVSAVRAYSQGSGLDVPAQPWIFGGWVAALGGWLDYNAAHGGRGEVERTLASLRGLAANLDEMVASLQ
ncbi:phosphotransferase [Actinoplanes sp. NPDC049596]|uniref:phosphotransferase n=1 Tax=unclassified Actinoplanes TaxID=2626549 RepID=UPI0034282C17